MTQISENIRIGTVVVTASLRSMRRGWKYQKSGKWYITTRAGAVVATFSTEGAANAWWRRFQLAEGVEQPRKLTSGEPKPKEPKVNVRKSSHQKSKSVETSAASESWERLDLPPTTVPRVMLESRQIFFEIMLEAFFEWHPEFKGKRILQKNFLRAVEQAFSKGFVTHCLVQLAKSPPTKQERAGWLYHIDGKQTLIGRSLKAAFHKLAKIAIADLKNRQSSKKRRLSNRKEALPFEHRPVGRGKDGGRWGT